MTYKNINVVDEFVNFGEDENIKAKHLFFEKDVLFSYGYHYPLCIRLRDCFIINKDGYSRTTANHKGKVIRSLPKNSIVFLNTQEIKEICANTHDFRFINYIDLQKLKILKELN